MTKRLAVVAGSVILLSACGGKNMISASGTAHYISDFVFQKTGFRAVDVRCPSGIPAKPGGRFTCHFTGPEGPYTAYLKIMNVHGTRVVYELKTQPSSRPAPALR